MILPNVNVCDNVFIAAGALVSKSINDSGIWGGVPAIHIGTIEDLIKKRIDYRQHIYSYNMNNLINKLWNSFEANL